MSLMRHERSRGLRPKHEIPCVCWKSAFRCDAYFANRPSSDTPSFGSGVSDQVGFHRAHGVGRPRA